MPKHVIVSGHFDNLRSRDLRFLHEAGRLGELTVLLWPDETVTSQTGAAPKFPFSERRYLLSSIRYVHSVVPFAPAAPAVVELAQGIRADIWVDRQPNAAHQAFCRERKLEYRIVEAEQLQRFPEPDRVEPGGRKKVLVTGCYDWLHSGHVRFFEEVSTYGDLYVVVGHDANIRLLKGPGHPLLPAEERRYQVGSIRFVTQALISTGNGWLDAEPEIQRLKPDIYAVNEEGDRGGKREYCAAKGIEYVVLKRAPAPGLPARTSTDLRGF